MITVARDPRFDKMKFVILQAIKNMIKVQEYERYFKQQGANDVIVMANVSANMGN
jgi:hypothetical protein